MEETLRLDEIIAWEQEVYRAGLQLARDRAVARFGGNLCPWCGSTFGMIRLYLEMLAISPPCPGERFFRCEDPVLVGQDKGDEDGEPWVWQICPECNGREVVEDGFHELSHEDVDALVAGYVGELV